MSGQPPGAPDAHGQHGLAADSDPPADAPPSLRRPGRGTLAARITLADDWDSAGTNEEIARDFGLLP